MKVKMFMNAWVGMEPRYAHASAQCPDKAIGTLLSFVVDIPDEYVIGKEDHALGPVGKLKVEATEETK